MANKRKKNTCLGLGEVNTTHTPSPSLVRGLLHECEAEKVGGQVSLADIYIFFFLLRDGAILKIRVNSTVRINSAFAKRLKC